MSLINQVLRDLDKRHAAGPAAPLLVKAPHVRAAWPNAWRRAGRWSLGMATTVAAIVAGGVAQGSIPWPGRAGVPAAPQAVAVALPVAPMAMAPAAPTAAPVPPVSPALPVATPEPPPIVQALAAPTPRPAFALPRTERKAHQHELVADTHISPALPAAARPEARIDKHASARTPQERADAHYQRGVAAHQAGQINESADAFLAALREDPRHTGARVAQAGLLIGQSRPDEAAALLQEGLALAPQQPALSLMLARLQAERQDLSGAADTLQAAAANASGNAEYLGLHAAILQRANRHAEAAEQFSAALRLAPAHSVWWMGLGISLAATGQHGAAREAFTRAKAIGALSPEAGHYVELRLRQLL